MNIKDQIILDLKKSLEKLGISGCEPALEHPAEETRGDYSTNVALSFKGHGPSKLDFKSPLALAKKIVENFPPTAYLEKIEAVPPGFINFWLKNDFLINVVGEIVKQGDDYGQTDLLKAKKIMVEFAHPNTHKMFHIGHLRNITTGESIVRLLEANGAKVFRTNYQGDVGMHIAKTLYGISFEGRGPSKLAKLKTLDEKIKFLGEAYVVGSRAFEEDEKAKKEIGEINKKIYKKDPEIIKLWEETRAWSLEYFDRIYKRVYTTFDRLYFESEVAERGKELVLQNVGKVFEKSDGAIIFPGEKFGSHTRVFINSEGNPTYEGKDMGLGELQFKEYNPDLLIHNLGPEQLGYTQVMFEALAQIFPETRGREYHRAYGWVKLKKGKMSSRTGQVILGEWLLDEVKKILQKKYKMKDETAEVVAIAGVKYSLLKVGVTQEMAFDIDESINLEGDSGPYLQYTYARCRSVLKKANNEGIVIPAKAGIQIQRRHAEFSSASVTQEGRILNQVQDDVKTLESEELVLLRTLYKFPEIVASAGKTYSPNLLCGYLFDLAGKFNSFYNKCSILNPEPQEARPLEATREIRLKLTEATGQIIKNGLYLLGIKVVEKM